MSPEEDDLYSVIYNYLEREEYYGLSTAIAPDVRDNLSYELSQKILASGYLYGQDKLDTEYERGFDEGREDGVRDTEWDMQIDIDDLETQIRTLTEQLEELKETK